MNYDFSGLALDAPITDELIGSVSGIRGLVQNLRQHIGGDTVTLADLAGHRATLLQGPRFVGTGTEVADQMEEWIEAEACDGFVDRRHPLPGRLRGRRPPGRARAPAPGRVPRPLHRRHPARHPRAGPPGRRSAMPEAAGPLHGRAGGGRGHAGRRPAGGHGHGRVRGRRHQGGAARGRRPPAHLGRPQGRDRTGVEEHEPQQALRDPGPPPDPTARISSTACST